jgi:hypothetical protein
MTAPLMIEATHLKAPRHRSQSAKKGDVLRRIGRTKGWLKLQAACRLRWSSSTANPASERRADERLQGGSENARRLSQGQDPIG